MMDFVLNTVRRKMLCAQFTQIKLMLENIISEKQRNLNTKKTSVITSAIICEICAQN